MGANWRSGDGADKKGNMTLVLTSSAEANKAKPATTDIRWTHIVSIETLKTTLDSFGEGVNMLRSSELNMLFSEVSTNLVMNSMDMAGELVYDVSARHCSASGLCSEWFHIFDTPTFFTPTPPKVIRVTAPNSGGSLVVEVEAPPVWGHHAVLRGRSFQCFVYFNGLPVSSTNVAYEPGVNSVTTLLVSDLLSSQEYTILLTSMNGDVASEKSESVSGKPNKNVPSQPDTPPATIEIYSRHIVVKIKLPSMNGAPITKCKISVGEVGDCGIELAQYKRIQEFTWNGGVFLPVSNTSDAAGVVSGFVNPPPHYSEHILTVFDILSDEEYVVKHSCGNVMGYSSSSIPVTKFKTPPVINSRQIGIATGNDELCEQK
jgi:hypothetical protein